jgi:hypothetical protein
MPDNAKGKTGRLNNPIPGNIPDNNAIQIFYHQRRAEGLAQYAPMVVPLLKDVLFDYFDDKPGYGVDDNIDVDADVMRYGWRIFKTVEAPADGFSLTGELPAAGTRKTILAVELLFSESGHPNAFLVDTRRTRTSVKTGLLGIKQRIEVTEGASKKTALSEHELKSALKEIVKTVER